MKLSKNEEMDNLRDELNMLLTQMAKCPEDKREIYPQLREKIDEMRSAGYPEFYALHVLKQNWKNAQEF